jgi:phospholipid/cholesterol/gamma-HCH transport system substrate-binding protein
MTRSVIETVLGAVVLLVAGVFLVFAYSSADIKPVTGYKLQAKFNAIDGLTPGSDVRIGGVKVGSVLVLEVDQEYYQAVVTLSIQNDIKLAIDSKAVVTSDGMLGGKYVKIEPGNADEFLAHNGIISNTKDVVSLEELLGKVIFLVTDEKAE